MRQNPTSMEWCDVFAPNVAKAIREFHDRIRRLRQIFRYILPRFRPYLARGVLGTCLSATGAAFGVLSTLAMASLLEVLKGSRASAPAASGTGINALFDLNTMGREVTAGIWGWLGHRDPSTVTWFVCVLVVVTVMLTVLLTVAGRWLWMTVRVRLSRQMQVDLFDHLLRLPMTFHVHQRVGSLISRLQIDVQGIGYILPTLFDSLVRSPLMLIGFVFLLVRTNVTLTLVTLASAGLYVAGMLCVGRLAGRAVVARSKTVADLIAMAQEALLSIRIVKAFCAERREVSRLDREARKLADTELREHLFEKEIPQAAERTLGIVTLGVVAVAAANYVARAQLSQEGMLLFLAATAGMLKSAASIGGAVVELYVLSACAGRLLELWNVANSAPEGVEEVTEFRTGLAVERVGFTYGGTYVLRDVSLTIKRGEVIGLVGPSGAGKSTLVDLLVRLYDPTEGVITLDGRDIRRFTMRAYRGLFGIVSQESFLFNDTVRKNIAYGNPDVSDADIVKAAQIADAHEFIMELPDGYDTIIGERGVRLSGGQRQRIAIARAIVHQPPILIFDEATSSLDSESERLVQQAMGRVIKDCTAIIVAHRLTTLQVADRIVVLDQGRIVQEGTHYALVGQDGVYRKLYEAQFAEENAVGAEATGRGGARP